MWTIIYTDDKGAEHYDRFLTRDEVIAFIKDEGLANDEDALVFCPLADDYSYIPSQLV